MFFGYINDKENIESKITEMNARGVSKVFIENDNIRKTEFKKLLDEVKELDTIIIAEITHIKTIRQMCELIQFSYEKKIELIIGDIRFDFMEKTERSKGIIEMSNLIYSLEKGMKQSRIKKGINEAIKKGKKVGRPGLTMETIPQIVKDLYPIYESGIIGVTELAKRCEMSRPRIVKYIKFIEGEKGVD